MIVTRVLYGALFATLLSFPATTTGQAAPEFAVRATTNGIDVRGTAASNVHVSVLRAAAARYAPERDSHFDMTVVTPSPSGWSVITELALRVAMTLEEGEVRVAPDSISIAGTTHDADELRRLRGRLSAVRQSDMHLDSRVIEVSADRTPFDTLCRRQFFTLARDNRVRYIDRNDQLRSGAQGALDRLVELMHDCPNLHVGIVSRTESSAGAVADYLMTAGIDPARVRATARSVDPADGAEAPPASDRDVAFELFAP